MKDSEFRQLLPLTAVIPWSNNPRNISEQSFSHLKKKIKRWGQFKPLLIDKRDGKTVLGGNMRLRAYQELGIDQVWVSIVNPANDAEALEIALADNESAGTFDESKLESLLSLHADNIQLEDYTLQLGTGISLSDWYQQEEIEQQEYTTLCEKFIVPPFSILDARQGYWQERKQSWIKLGIQSELGRGEVQKSLESAFTLKTKLQSPVNMQDHEIEVPAWATSSLFDPVLCEIAYRWFCPEEGKIIDPFAGGSVRGIVASKLGYTYTGVDLRSEQVEANQQQVALLCDKNEPRYIVGDSQDIAILAPGQYDFIFSCPPYFDLEVYSDDKQDLSNCENYPEFLTVYQTIIRSSISMLKENCFACFVVGDIRDKQGFYRNFVSDTIAAFQKSGAILYNEAILITATGTLPVRAGKAFSSNRKLGKAHQNVLIFYKGNPKAIKGKFGAVTVNLVDTCDTSTEVC